MAAAPAVGCVFAAPGTECAPGPPRSPPAVHRACGRVPRPVAVAADHEALVRIIGTGDLRHVAVIEQRQLQRPIIGGQCLDRGSAQSGDPVEPGRTQRLSDPRIRQHAAVAHHDDALQLEPLLQLVDLC